MGIDDIVDKAKKLVEDQKDNLGEMADKVKGALGDRDMDSVKEDLAELKDIATGEGSLADKAKAAVDAVKDSGAPGEGSGGAA